MKRRPRLSLRARMLVLLISVTTIFLLIMGLVSATVLSKRLGAQFDQDLVAAAARPQQLPHNPSGYLAEAVSISTGTITVFTPGPLATELQQVLAGLSLPQYRKQFAAAADHSARSAAARNSVPTPRRSPPAGSAAPDSPSRPAASSWSWRFRPAR